MTQNPNFDNLRQFPRVDDQFTLNVQKIKYPLSQNDKKKCVGRNISENGICFTFANPYEPGTKLQLEIKYIGWQRHKKSILGIIDETVALAPLSVIAEVAWCRNKKQGIGFEIGAKFLDVYEDDFKALQKYLEILT